MNINDLKIGEYYAFEFKIFKGEPPVMVKVIDWGEENHTVYVVRALHQNEKPFECTVVNLRELTSGELAEIGKTNLKLGLENFFGTLYDATEKVWQGVQRSLTLVWETCLKPVQKISCNIFDKHDVYWELDVRYSDSDHEHYLVGYCKDCGKRHTKGLYH